MNNTPLSNRLHVGIFGETNSGKSTLFNALLGTNTSIVSNVKGTTTDPVVKAMELIPFGPIALVDTAGLNDNTELGDKRMTKTNQVLNRIDFAIYAVSAVGFNYDEFKEFEKKLTKHDISYMLVITHCDTATPEQINNAKQCFNNAYTIDFDNKQNIEEFRKILSKELEKKGTKEKSLIAGLVDEGKTVLLVTPIDSSAPKGRLILPQVQLMRDCIDNRIICLVCDLFTLEDALKSCNNIGLVVTDSQAFKEVHEIVKDEYLLTSFSILFARQKGELNDFYDGVSAIQNLEDGDTVLMSEVCTHNVTHEDIGRFKIPNLLKKITGKDLNFDFVTGRDFPDNLSEYKLVVHCGGCMANKKEMQSRIMRCKNIVPITNYGLVMAYCNDILELSVKVLKDKEAL